jgi:hypothetical protein
MRRGTARSGRALLLVISMSGCGAVEDREAREFEQLIEEQIAGDGDVSVDPDTESITIEDDAGSFTTGSDLGAPAWFPSALQLPDDFSFEAHITVDDIMSARGSTALDVVSLAEFYESAVDGLGWTIDGSTVVEPGFSNSSRPTIRASTSTSNMSKESSGSWLEGLVPSLKADPSTNLGL